jgi:broad-specificity NMP kinase
MWLVVCKTTQNILDERLTEREAQLAAENWPADAVEVIYIEDEEDE